MSLRTAILALTLGLAPGPVPAQTTSSLLPHEVGAAEAWRAFRERPIDGDLVQHFERLHGMVGDDGELDANACEASALRELEQQIPVSLAFWWLQTECAERRGDEAEAERSLKAFAALARHALESAPRRHTEDAPIPIVSELDLWLLIQGLEMELGYAYLDLLSSGPFVPYLVSLWDPIEEREHLLSFDYIDVLMDLVEKVDGFRSLPARIHLRESLMKASEDQPAELPIARARQFIQAARSSPDERGQRLHALAVEGDFHAAVRLFRLCSSNALERCGTQTVDALLPFAEAGLAEALSMLGTAHALGLGVRRDTRAAADLYTRADARLGGHEASLASARSWLQPPYQGAMPRALKQRVELAAKQGDADARDLLLLNEIAEAIENRPLKRIPRKLESAASSNSAWVRTAYGSLLLSTDLDRAFVHLVAGARMGGFQHTTALLGAISIFDRNPLDDVELLQLHERAGYGGSADSALWVGRHYRDQRDYEEAQRWLLGAALLGNTRGFHESATLIVDQWRGDDTLMAAAAMLEEVLRREDNAEAAVMLADLLMQGLGGVTMDRPRAAQLLRAQLANGYIGASELLAVNLLNGKIEALSDENPLELLERAAASGNAEAMSAIAMLIYSGDLNGEPEAVLDWFQRAIDAGHLSARNNRAWFQCVSTDSRYFNPEAGLADALQLGDASTLPPALRDTVATCHAAVGDFDQAIAIERSIVDELAALDVRPEASAYFVDKLARFERGEVFRESPEVHRISPASRQ